MIEGRDGEMDWCGVSGDVDFVLVCCGELS